MKLNNRGKVGTVILIVILLIGFLGCAGYIVYDKVIKKEEPKTEEKVETTTTETTTTADEKTATTETTQSTTTNKEETKEEIATRLFKAKMDQYKNTGSNYNQVEYRITDYSIVKVEIVEKIPDDYEIKEGEFIARITYNVTPENANNSPWMAGNGELSNGVVTGKTNYYHIAKIDGEYNIIKGFTGF